ncbi:MAG: response regulator [Chitinivibrionales bacterium]|nr:response regulator [Chitinivibrionales bacterium]
MDRSRVTLLVVEDDPQMRSMIADYLGEIEGYHVCAAVDGVDALENFLPHQRVDLVISDINMPKMKGFELLAKVREQYPDTKRMLITAYNVEDYFELAMKYDVGNIFVKTSPFGFAELSATIQNLLTGNIFGLERYFPADAPISKLTVKSGENLHADACRVMDLLPAGAHDQKLELVLVEILTNAVFYGVRQEAPDDRGSWKHEFELSDGEAVEVSVMCDDEKYGISIVDPGGRLKKSDILYWLNRQVSTDERGLPMGVFDTHGRGLFIARRYIDRLIVNIDRNRRTEVIVLNYHGQLYEGYKPLYINEI